MDLRFQYNKTSLQELEKLMQIRKTALPVLKSKETALRQEVQKRKIILAELKADTDSQKNSLLEFGGLWNEFDFSLLVKGELQIRRYKVAGVALEELVQFDVEEREFNPQNRPAWFIAGLEELKTYNVLKERCRFFIQSIDRLETARRKTTQKVNLFEKVQIPAYESAIIKVKRYLEDEETIAKASQKMLKKRLSRA